MIKVFSCWVAIALSLSPNLFAIERAEKVFTTLYEMKAWGVDEAGNGTAGPDSAIENVQPYIKFLENFIRSNHIKSIVDVGCGDWSFSKGINWKNVNYIGIDIVKPVIERNQKTYASGTVKFLHNDINEMALPEADLLICKDVLQNLPNQDIQHFLNKVNNYKYCLFINDALPQERPFNRSIALGDHRPLDLSKPPFNLLGAKVFSYTSGSNQKEVFLKMNASDQSIIPSKKRHFVINNIHPYQGFFSVFTAVMGYLDLYDSRDIDGLTVNFQANGLFYEAGHGQNWWNYYFEPIDFGNKQNADVEYSVANETGRVAYLTEIGLSRNRIVELMKKYITIKPDVLAEVNQFTNENFGNKFVIGVHYRGTDKSCEAKSLCYEAVSSEVSSQIDKKQPNDFVIFVATDEQGFLEHMQKAFEGKVVSSNCLRSSDKTPIHYFNSKNTSPYKTGKEALLDCLLLSKCHHLVRTSSCLSLVSTYFNPNLTETLLNQRTTHCYNRF